LDEILNGIKLSPLNFKKVAMYVERMEANAGKMKQS
jgi:hypothetical protein